MFAVAMVTVFALGLPVTASAQVNAIKDGWLVMKVHSEFVDEDVLSGSNIDVDVKNGVVTLQGTVPSEAGRARPCLPHDLHQGREHSVQPVKQLRRDGRHVPNRLRSLQARTRLTRFTERDLVRVPTPASPRP